MMWDCSSAKAMKSHRRILRTWSTKPSRAGPLEMGRWPLKRTRSKQESTATIELVNLVTKRDSVFMASSGRLGAQANPILPEGRRHCSSLLVAGRPHQGVATEIGGILIRVICVIRG